MKVSPVIRAQLELLGVSIDASPTDLKKAYHRLALLYHPDRNPTPTASLEFHKITSAYELLSDQTRVAELNRKYLKNKYHSPVVEGFEVTFGSFFGYRLFDPGQAFGNTKALKLSGKSSRTSLPDANPSDPETWLPLEENNSILDHPAFDAIEVVYAGKLSSDDEAELKGRLRRTP
ncbi:MAG: DnaJ domain-containing protein, partial [Bdellovibrionota bacterium]